jgi:hypothetical protein
MIQNINISTREQIYLAALNLATLANCTPADLDSIELSVSLQQANRRLQDALRNVIDDNA